MKNLLFLFLFFLSFCKTKKDADAPPNTADAYFDAIQTNDIKLGIPKKGEWLFDHKEPGQTLEQYKAASPVKISGDAFIIYLKPIGSFSSLQNAVLESAGRYLEIFFQQKVVIMKPVSDSVISRFAMRKQSSGVVQLLAPYILDPVLKGRIPPKGIVLMAITSKDLYPGPSWNYVFGLASYADRVAVSSMFRLGKKPLDSASVKTCLTRLINICAHEIGHMFSLHHCTYAKCIMNGSNSLYETDLDPNRLCSECQKKLYWNFGFDCNKRLEELTLYFQKNKLERDINLSKADLDKTRPKG